MVNRVNHLPDPPLGHNKRPRLTCGDQKAAEVAARPCRAALCMGPAAVTVGEDEQSGRVRRHGEHERGLPRNGRLPVSVRIGPSSR